MTAQLAIFYLLGAVAVAGALGAVLARNVVHAALMLLITLLGVAGIFLVAVAEFLALAQILIYGGAVTVVILFAIMLTRSDDMSRHLDRTQRPLAVVGAVGVFALLLAAFLASDLSTSGSAQSVASEGRSAFEALGHSLFVDWAIPFELASLVLLVALIGAIMLARGEGD